MPSFQPNPNASKTDIDKWGSTIKDPKAPIKDRAFAMWGLRFASDAAATDALIDYVVSYTNPAPEANALLQHEAAFSLGQKGDAKAIAALEKVLRDEKHEAIVRHEAAEALAALASNPSSDKAHLKAVLEEFAKCPIGPVADSCIVGLGRVAWVESGSVQDADAAKAKEKFPQITDPSAAFGPGHGKSTAELKKLVVDPATDLYNRYLAMYTLRNEYVKTPTDEVVQALIAALETPTSALLRHQTAYVLGECLVGEAGGALVKRLQDTQEAGFTRHESALALGKLLEAGKYAKEAKEALTAGCNDAVPVVRDSCALALELPDFVARA